MKRETILKVILVLIMGVALFAKPVSVFAVSNNPTDINEFWENQGSFEDITEEIEPETELEIEPETQPNTNINTNTNTTTNTTDLPKAGLVEDTMMIVSVLALIGVAVFTFVKISDYSNI